MVSQDTGHKGEIEKLKGMSKDEWNAAIDKFIQDDNKLIGVITIPERLATLGMRRAPLDRMVTEGMIIRHALTSQGNPDPMYTDPEYARGNRFGGLIAPPGFISGATYYPGGQPQVAGFNWYYGGTSWDYTNGKPIRPGDETRAIHRYKGFIEKPAKRAKPYRLFWHVNQATYRNQRDEIIGVLTGTEIITATYPHEIDKMTDSLYKGRENYYFASKEELDEIHQWYDDELAGKHRRGQETRYWEDVNEGDDIGMVREGPMSLVDECGGASMLGRSCGGDFTTSWMNLRRIPGEQRHDPDTGDVMDRVNWHYSDRIAHEIGLPRWLHMGPQSEQSTFHLICNWMGDDGLVRKCGTQQRAVKLAGDLSTYKGTVVRKYEENGEHLVDLEVWGEIPNLDGMVFTPGNATVKLISRAE